MKSSWSWLDGSQRNLLIDSNLQWPNGLSVDYAQFSLYWCDTFTNKIERYHYRTNQRETILESHDLLIRPYGLTISSSGNILYWTQFTTANIVRYNLSSNASLILRNESPQLLEIKTFSNKRQPSRDNPCLELACEEFCFITPKGPVCGCRDGSRLNQDLQSCSAADQDWRGGAGAVGCAAGEFECVKTGKLECISSKYLCDGVKDCPDGSDEGNHCQTNRTCTAEDFQCEGGSQCISARWRCDGDSDCDDGSDELHCPDCSDNKFLCGVSKDCIPAR